MCNLPIEDTCPLLDMSEWTLLMTQTKRQQLKICSYIAQYPVHQTDKTLYTSPPPPPPPPPGRPVHTDTVSPSLGSIQPCCNDCTETFHSCIFTTLCNQVLIYAEWTDVSWRERKCPCLKTTAKGSESRLPWLSESFHHWATTLQNNKQISIIVEERVTFCRRCPSSSWRSARRGPDLPACLPLTSPLSQCHPFVPVSQSVTAAET